MTTKTLFSRIIDRELPADILYEDDVCVAIKDIHPQAPVHVLIIPRKPIVNLSHAEPGDQAILGHLMLAAGEVARQLGVADAFRIMINNGQNAGQTVFHLHLHLLANKRFAEQGLFD